jgi:hypothetical protein
VSLIAVNTVDRGITIVQVTSPGITTTLRRRPKVGVAGARVVIAISATGTGRRGIESGGVEIGVAGEGSGSPVFVGGVVAGQFGAGGVTVPGSVAGGVTSGFREIIFQSMPL